MKRYSKEVHDFIADNVCGTNTKDLVVLVNGKFGTSFTEGSMKSYKQNHGLRSGTKTGNPLGYSTVFSPEIQDYIAKNSNGTSPKDMASLLNTVFGTGYAYSQLRAYYKNHGLHSGIDAKFPKGHVPPNKGKKGYCSPGSEKGWFSDGHTPFNKQPIGTVLMKADGYLWEKTGEGARNWKQKHVLVWEDANGPVPKGSVITFLDGNRENISLDNLSCITMAESLELTRSRLRSSCPEFTSTGILIVKVKKAKFKQKKRGKHHETQEKNTTQQKRD